MSMDYIKVIILFLQFIYVDGSSIIMKSISSDLMIEVIRKIFGFDFLKNV